MDKSGSPDEAKTLAQATTQALAPQFHLRADRFYNAPDTEIDFTDQGGLMWGTAAVGKLAAGPEPMKPTVVPFVDEEAGPEVIAKVQRRLQHFIDRKIAAAFEPLLALTRDETLTGLAKGFAFRMGEQFGIIPRGDIAEDVKALDQEARAALRKHGIRFGQFTVFQQPLLKPAPTRLRLLLWSLWKGLQEFPESPKAGHVTVTAAPGAVPGYYAMAGYRAAGERAIRIDMLERLADMLRDKDSRAGFEAAPDMLSITGLSLDQFAVLMTGLGYKAEKLERPKVKVVKPQAVVAEPVAVEVVVEEAVNEVEAPIADQPVAEDVTEPVIIVDVEIAAVPVAETVPAPVADTAQDILVETTPETAEAVVEDVVETAPVEMESYYSFTWAGRAATRRDRPQGQPRADGESRPPRDRRPRGDRARADAPKVEGAVEATPDPVLADGAPVADKPRGKRDHARKAPRDDSRYKPQPGSKPEGGDKPVPREERVREDNPRPERPREDRNAKPERKPYPKRDDDRSNKPQVFEARPVRENQGRDKAIDMDNPFAAALAAFKTK